MINQALPDERRPIVLSNDQFEQLREEQESGKRAIAEHVAAEGAWQRGMSAEVGSLREHLDALKTAQDLQGLELRGVTAEHRYLADQFTELSSTVSQQVSSIRGVELGLSENTRLTKESIELQKGVADILAAGRVASGAASWLGSMSKPLVALSLLFGGAWAVSKGAAIDVWQSISTLFQR